MALEIGFGMGEATALMAAEDPDTGILAVDVHTPGQGNLLGLADRLGLDNVRVANGDAIILLREMLAPEALASLRVYFPDPWPKTRHHKRRLIQPDFLSLAAPRLAPGALLHCATDWEPYAEQMHDVLSAHPAFENTVELPGAAVEGTDGVVRHGYAPRPAFRPRTRFEGQGLDKGHVVHDLLFRKVAELPRADRAGRHPRVTRWTGTDATGAQGDKFSRRSVAVFSLVGTNQPSGNWLGSFS
ncbi:tRNA (guanosine(46)-N7)-methyltransferase TrmB [Actinomadura keratinilytica]